MGVLSYFKIMRKRKILTGSDHCGNKNEKNWNIFNLTSVGTTTTLGFGIYILVGHISHVLSGPSSFVAFLIAAVVSLIAALCYIELGYRIPKKGSTFTYNYVIIGELIAFIVGWTIILEYIIGAACVSRGFSLYLDTIISNILKDAFREIAPIKWHILGSYFDFFAFLLPIFLSVLLAIGLKRHALTTTLLTVINIGFILFLFILGVIKADVSNWNINTINISTYELAGQGGFFPYDGIKGTMKAAALCVFCFIGFDCLATTINVTTIQETKKKYPISVLISFIILTIIFCMMSIILTLMWPYYHHNSDAWIPLIFEDMRWPYAKWIVAIGAMICLITSLFSFLYALLPIISTMASDGLIFKFLGNTHYGPKIPRIGILFTGLISSILAGLFNVTQLVSMLSIGTLLGFITVAISIIIMRFAEESLTNAMDDIYRSTSEIIKQNITFSKFSIQCFNTKRIKTPSKLSDIIVRFLLCMYVISSIGLALLLRFANKEIFRGEIWAVILSLLFLVLLILKYLAISVQPRQNIDNVFFKVPLVPLLPLFSIFVNIYLIVMLDVASFIRFGIWMILGLVIYFSCVYSRDQGVRNLSVIHSISVSSDDRMNNGTLKSITFNISDDNQNKMVINEIRKSDMFTYTDKLSETNKISLENNTSVMTNEIQKLSIIDQTYSVNAIKKISMEKLITNNTSLDLFDLTDSSGTIIPPVVMNDNGEFQTKEVDVANKDNFDVESQNSSNKSSYDDINLASEVEQSLTEKKEPNGNIYFVEEIKDSSKFSPRTEERETTTALAILDDVIQDEEARPKSFILAEYDAPVNIIPIVIDAVVHQEDLDQKIEEVENYEKEIKLVEIENENEVVIPIPPPLPDFIVPEYGFFNKRIRTNNETSDSFLSSLKSPDDSSHHPEIIETPKDSQDQNNEENDIEEHYGKSKEFMKKLTALIGEKPKAILKPETVKSIRIVEKDERIEHSLNLQKSKSENNIPKMILKEIQIDEYNIKNNEKPVENYNNAAHSKPTLHRGLSVPHVQFKGIENKIENRESSCFESIDTKIPEAPHFDPILYKSLGRKNYKPILIKSDGGKKIENSNKGPIKALGNIQLDTVGTTETSEVPEDDIKSNMKSIKDKLEMIFQRGPPEKFNYPKQTPNIEPQLDISSESETVSHMTNVEYELGPKFSKPFDTVKLQKLRFSDVLKSIKEDTKPSVIRNNSFKKNELETNNNKTFRKSVSSQKQS